MVTGDVTIGAESRVLHGAVLSGDLGPHTHLNDTTVEDEVFVATGVSMFPGSRTGTVYGVARGTSIREIMRRQCAAFRPSGDRRPE